jgi:hypothetical protein
MPKGHYIRSPELKEKLKQRMLKIRKTNISGKENPNYKGGRSFDKNCQTCGITIDYRATWCPKHKASNTHFLGKHHTKKAKAIIGQKSSLKFTDDFKELHYRSKSRGKKKRESNGYILIKNYEHPNRNSHNDILEHIFVMSEYLGRPIEHNEVVHHIDSDRTNNTLSNLYLYKNRREHMRIGHGSVFRILKPLLKRNIIEFKNGEYKLVGDGEV